VPTPIGFWPMDATFGGKELTGRNLDMELFNAALVTDEDPLGNGQGERLIRWKLCD